MARQRRRNQKDSDATWAWVGKLTAAIVAIVGALNGIGLDIAEINQAWTKSIAGRIELRSDPKLARALEETNKQIKELRAEIEELKKNSHPPNKK